MDIKKLLNEPPIYTAYYSNDFGNHFSAFLTQDPSISSSVDCAVVKSEDYMALLQFTENLIADRDLIAETLIAERDLILSDMKDVEFSREQFKSDYETALAENGKLIAEREQYENHDVYATLYEERLIDLSACLGLVITEADDRGFYQDQCNDIYRSLPEHITEKIEEKEEYYKTELHKPESFEVLIKKDVADE